MMLKLKLYYLLYLKKNKNNKLQKLKCIKAKNQRVSFSKIDLRK